MKGPGQQVFRGYAPGDAVAVSSESNPHDGRRGTVVGARGAQVLVYIVGLQRDIWFYPHELVKG